MHILLVEDSRRLRESIRTGLERMSYAVDVAEDGDTGLRFAMHNPYDVVILDLMLPGMDGLSILRTLREAGRDAHVLILTAKNGIEERVAGLREGADDYLGKPFAFDELVARIEALVRRRYQTKNPLITIGPLQVDTAARTVTRGKQSIQLSRREYALLEYLANRSGEVVTRPEIEDHLYGERNFPLSNAVDRIVCALRKKIECEGAPPLLVTRRGMGYVLAAPETSVELDNTS